MICGGDRAENLVEGIEQGAFYALARLFVTLGDSEKIIDIDVPILDRFLGGTIMSSW